MVPLLWRMRREKFRETECFAQGHTARQNRGLLTLKQVLIGLPIASAWNEDVHLMTTSKPLCSFSF